jgi:hypothetical protein
VLPGGIITEPAAGPVPALKLSVVRVKNDDVWLFSTKYCPDDGAGEEPTDVRELKPLFVM